jgi:hypothetical protein
MVGKGGLPPLKFRQISMFQISQTAGFERIDPSPTRKTRVMESVLSDSFK